ncbi:uncharacterized protein LOC143034366 [Oratosquilla oratoria]|uniref:uncharacterized protein LOC143034366 n=1 Tax=Oratosquilla oratoria TaxID=337810 RepID=UPI003F75FA92
MAPIFMIKDTTTSLVKIPGSGWDPKASNLSLNLARQIGNRDSFPADVTSDIVRFSQGHTAPANIVQLTRALRTITSQRRLSPTNPAEAPRRAASTPPPNNPEREESTPVAEGANEASKKRTRDGASAGDAVVPRDVKSPRVVNARARTVPPPETLGSTDVTASSDGPNTVAIATAAAEGGATTPEQNRHHTVFVVVGTQESPRQSPAEGRTSPVQHGQDCSAEEALASEKDGNFVDMEVPSELERLKCRLREMEEKAKQDELERKRLCRENEILNKKLATVKEIFRDKGKLNAVLHYLKIRLH